MAGMPSAAATRTNERGSECCSGGEVGIERVAGRVVVLPGLIVLTGSSSAVGITTLLSNVDRRESVASVRLANRSVP
jgi:hypothetical protein